MHLIGQSKSRTVLTFHLYVCFPYVDTLPTTVTTNTTFPYVQNKDTFFLDTIFVSSEILTLY